MSRWNRCHSNQIRCESVFLPPSPRLWYRNSKLMVARMNSNPKNPKNPKKSPYLKSLKKSPYLKSLKKIPYLKSLKKSQSLERIGSYSRISQVRRASATDQAGYPSTPGSGHCKSWVYHEHWYCLKESRKEICRPDRHPLPNDWRG